MRTDVDVMLPSSSIKVLTVMDGCNLWIWISVLFIIKAIPSMCPYSCVINIYNIYLQFYIYRLWIWHLFFSLSRSTGLYYSTALYDLYFAVPGITCPCFMNVHCLAMPIAYTNVFFQESVGPKSLKPSLHPFCL